jgi:hypothetical protein
MCFPLSVFRVGPGANDGYTNIPKGGFQQDQIREYALPKTTDELRVIGKEKLSYEPPVIPGQNTVTVPGIQAEVKKNKPDRFQVLGMDRVNTEVGAQTAARVYPEQPLKTQARATTGVEYEGPARGNAIFTSYIRVFHGTLRRVYETDRGRTPRTCRSPGWNRAGYWRRHVFR